MVNKAKGVTVLMTTTYKAWALCYLSHLLIISTLLYRYNSHLNYLDEKLRLWAQLCRDPAVGVRNAEEA